MLKSLARSNSEIQQSASGQPVVGLQASPALPIGALFRFFFCSEGVCVITFGYFVVTLVVFFAIWLRSSPFTFFFLLALLRSIALFKLQQALIGWIRLFMFGGAYFLCFMFQYFGVTWLKHLTRIRLRVYSL